MKRAASLAGRYVALVVLYVVLFVVGSRLFPVTATAGRSPAQAAQALLGLLGCAVIDTLLLALWAARTRLRGWRRWAMLAVVFYGVKTLSSELEALWFMPNVSAGMAPALFAMTVPLSLLFPLAVIAAFGDRAPVDGPAWRAPEVPVGWKLADWAVLSAVVYPALFYAAGYYIAFRSPAVRAFYGGYRGVGFLRSPRRGGRRGPLGGRPSRSSAARCGSRSPSRSSAPARDGGGSTPCWSGPSWRWCRTTCTSSPTRSCRPRSASTTSWRPPAPTSCGAW